MSALHVLALHGPNLNLLGAREPQHYGCRTLAEIDAMLEAEAERLDCFIKFHLVAAASNTAFVSISNKRNIFDNSFTNAILISR